MCLKAVLLTILQYYTTHRNPMGLESKFWNKLGFILILAHFPATWELKIWKFSNFGQNHFSDFETPFLAGLMNADWRVLQSLVFTQQKLLIKGPCIYKQISQSLLEMLKFCQKPSKTFFVFQSPICIYSNIHGTIFTYLFICVKIINFHVLYFLKSPS